jgi:hypothetical protein
MTLKLECAPKSKLWLTDATMTRTTHPDRYDQVMQIHPTKATPPNTTHNTNPQIAIRQCLLGDELGESSSGPVQPWGHARHAHTAYCVMCQRWLRCGTAEALHIFFVKALPKPR